MAAKERRFVSAPAVTNRRSPADYSKASEKWCEEMLMRLSR